MSKIAIDFGTTNTVVAIWRESVAAPETISLPGLSMPLNEERVSLIPSMAYLKNGVTGEFLCGYSVREAGMANTTSDRLFSSFKRAIASSTHPLNRSIDGAEWNDSLAGMAFLKSVVAQVLEHEQNIADELVITVPVQSFERYLKWLRDDTGLSELIKNGSIHKLRIVDESTAAAVGYEVRTPGDLILVFDFGGGTLDISLVRLPFADEGEGIVIDKDRYGKSTEAAARGNPEARVVAKAGRVLGGDDIDYWLLDDVLAKNNLDRTSAGLALVQLKNAAEAAKIRLSDSAGADISVFNPDTYQTYRASYTRSQFEEILDQHDFFGIIHRTIDKVLRGARAHGVTADDVNAVLLVGGTSLLPSVRRMLRSQFGAERVFEHKPFEAVAHGALGLAVGLGVNDFLYHSYGVRHLSPITGRHEWEEIIPSGVRYPLDEPVKLILASSRNGQEALELVIGEVEENAGGITEVMFGDRAILLVEGGLELRRIVPLNDEDGARTVAHLDPPGKAGEDRVEVIFTVDANRTLRVTVNDLQTRKTLLSNTAVVELR